MKLILFAQIVNVARDVMVWNSKTFIRSPLLPKEDKQIKMYRNWFSQNSKSYQDIKNDLNWWILKLLNFELSNMISNKNVNKNKFL